MPLGQTPSMRPATSSERAMDRIRALMLGRPEEAPAPEAESAIQPASLWDKIKEFGSSLGEQPVAKVAGMLGEMGDSGWRGNVGQEDSKWAGPAGSQMVAGMVDIPGKLPFNGPPGFYSRVNRIAEGLQEGKIHPNKLADLFKRGANPEEVAYRKLPEFIASAGDQSITKEALWKHLSENQPPKIEVTRKTATKQKTDRTFDIVDDDPYGLWEPPIEDITKYSDYQLPGGTNYQETLITMPPTKATTRVSTEFPHTTETVIPNQDIYRSPHWPEDPNVIVHSRGNQRTLPDGTTGNMTEELQSDLHAAGAREGYRQPDIDAETYPEWAKRNGFDPDEVLSPEETTARWRTHIESNDQRAKNQELVPDLPFKGDLSYNLAMKQAILDAANDPKAEWIGLTIPETQIRRYGTDQYTWSRSPDTSPAGWHVRQENLNNVEAVQLPRPLDEIPDYARKGKHFITSEGPSSTFLNDPQLVAKLWKRIQASPDAGEYRPRAAGMTQKYGHNYPDKFEKLLKPFGGQGMEQMPLSNSPGLAAKAWIERLTPEMKVQIQAKGFDLMTIALMAVGGNNMAQPQQEPR
jgi:hypothetical protein